jgi:hypothetical protein
VWQASLNDDNTYTPRGLLFYESEERRVKAMIEPDWKVFGEYTFKRTGAVFQGSLADLAPGLGRMRHEVQVAVLEGNFKDSLLHGYGRSKLRNGGNRNRGAVHRGAQGGAVQGAQWREKRSSVGEYAQDAKEGFGLRLYEEGRGQLVAFRSGSVDTVYAECQLHN